MRAIFFLLIRNNNNNKNKKKKLFLFARNITHIGITNYLLFKKSEACQFCYTK